GDIRDGEPRAGVCADDLESPLKDVKRLPDRCDEWNTRVGFVTFDLARIEDGEGVALDVELGVGRVEFVDAVCSVVRDAQEGPSERVEVRGGRRRGVLCGEPRGACVRRAGFRTRGRRRAAVDVPLALEYGVVLVPVLLLPGVEFDFGERAVGEVSADQAIERVVTKDGSDAGLD